MSYLVIMRHGQSQSNLDRLVAGHIDTPLTEAGKQQARETAPLIQDLSFDQAFVSTLRRTQETLAEVQAALGWALPVAASDNLRERCWGVQEGEPYGKEKEKYPEAEVATWFAWEGKPPKGESFADVSRRVTSYFEQEILPELKQGKSILLVGHLDMLKTLRQYLEKMPKEETNTLSLHNCEVRVYQYNEDGEVVDVQDRKVDT